MPPANEMADVVNQLSPPRLGGRGQLLRGRDGRLEIKNPLGKLLYHAVKLFNAMDNFRDQRLVDKYLMHSPPLHPRRTLDQAYFWSLRNSHARDRDQVVYRATSARPNELHHYDPDTGEWDCARYEFRAVPRRRSTLSVGQKDTNMGFRYQVTNRIATITERGRVTTSPGPNGNQTFEPRDLEMSAPRPRRTTQCHPNHGDGHTEESSPHVECPGCREAIQKLPRLIMVDQLWMWILDDSTIITCFPRRYGVNRKDSSGVAKAIRNRLGNLGNIQIHSAYDVALIVVDECCKVFFDHTKTDERQPEVLDIFAESISKVVSLFLLISSHCSLPSLLFLSV